MTAQPQALLIEADAHNLVALDALMREQNIAYKRNTTGADVIRQARSLLPYLRVILLSMDLPEHDPYTIYRELQADAALRRIPIVAIVSDESSVQARDFAALITRPLPRRTFNSVISDLLHD
jgi:PleD family two-component response regulator